MLKLVYRGKINTPLFTPIYLAQPIIFYIRNFSNRFIDLFETTTKKILKQFSIKF